ncbi:MAG: DUF4270 domain-containing protein [Bacteroidales bacterium]|nr:DUF4270 domain-containing protein [Bacteroidales bacterium]
MKTKIFFLSILTGFIYLTACDDTIDSIGSGIQPDGDKIEIYDLSLNISGETVKLDSIYAKSISASLGNIKHPVYGSLKGEYACQFYPSAEFELDSMIKNDIDSIKLQIMYFNFQGDPLTPMEVSVYPVDEPLKNDYYSGIDLTQYADMQTLLGKRAYTARDLNISDSIYDSSSSSTYKVLSVTLPKELGQKFFEEYKKGDQGAFASQEAFSNFFPGTYIASTFGNGCLLDVERTSIFIYYQRRWEAISTITGNDTIIEGTTYASLNVTKEVTQLNSYVNSGEEELLAPNADKMYLKTPAGLYSKLTIPLAQIIDSIGNRKFSNVELSLSAYPKEDSEYLWDFPGTYQNVGIELAKSKILLIEPDSVVPFFEQQKAADNLTSYYSTFNSSTSSYVFRNISNVLQNAIDKTEGNNYKDLELLVIPVTVPYYYASNDYYETNPLDYATYHYLYPSAVTLRKGGDNLKLKIIAADLEVNQN